MNWASWTSEPPHAPVEPFNPPSWDLDAPTQAERFFNLAPFPSEVLLTYREGADRVGFTLPSPGSGEVMNYRFRGVLASGGGEAASLVYSRKPVDVGATTDEIQAADAYVVRVLVAWFPADQVCEAAEKLFSFDPSLACLSFGGVEVVSLSEGRLLWFVHAELEYHVIYNVEDSARAKQIVRQVADQIRGA